MGSSTPVSSRGRLWQLPLFVASLALFGYAAWLLIDPQPGPTVIQKLQRARDYLAAERADPALAILNDVLRQERLTAQQEGVVRLMLADALETWQRQRDVSVPANHRQIVDQTRRAVKLGMALDDGARVRLAASHVALGQLPEALEQYRALAAGQNPARVRWLRRTIELEIETGEAAAARSSLESYLSCTDLTDGERSWALGQKARLLIDGGEYAAARDLLNGALELAANAHTEARQQEMGEYRYWLGYCAWRLEQWAQAERELRVARDLLGVAADLDADAALLLGRIRQRSDDWDGAIAFYNAVLSAHLDSPAAPQARLARGLCRIARGDAEAGIADITETVRWARERPGAWPKLGDPILDALAQGAEALSKVGHYAGAIELLELERQCRPKITADFLGRLARVYDRRIAQLEASPPPVGESAAADQRRRLAEARTRAGDAYVAWSRQLVLSDDKAYGQTLWQGIGLYDQAGDIQRAIAALEVFTSERPGDPLAPEAYYRLGQAYQAAAMFDKAIWAYRQLQGRYPNSLAASRSGVPMARALIAKGPDSYARAEQVLKAIIHDNPQITPEAAEFREAMGELAALYHRTGRYELAIAQLEEMTQRYPDDSRLAQLTFLMADSYRRSAGVLEAKVLGWQQAGPATRPAFSVEEATAERSRRLERARFLFRRVGEIYQATPPRTDLDRLYRKLACFYQADCVFDLGQYAEAIRLYDEAAFRYQDDASALAAYVQIVNANLAMGRTEEARAANERAKWMLRRMPPDAFEQDGAVLSRAAWEQWLAWSAQAGLWN